MDILRNCEAFVRLPMNAIAASSAAPTGTRRKPSSQVENLLASNKILNVLETRRKEDVLNNAQLEIIRPHHRNECAGTF